MNQDHSDNVFGSQADTYIEACFEKKCSEAKIGNYKDILNQWRNDKSTFSSLTAISGFDFQHYSMHDKSHSEAILRYIEMVLGKKRVRQLNASDLWLLLESAYCHDIGMSITYEELCAIWEEQEFTEYVESCLFHESQDQRTASQLYQKLDDLVHNSEKMKKYSEMHDIEECTEEYDELFGKKSWPVIWERYILLLYTEYIRKKHPERSKNYMINYGGDEEKRKIPGRMYEVVADVAFLHGEDFADIFRLVEKKENGFYDERMHPQFAAAMLRIGDLLDMDSNRFNMRMIKHMGLIPLESILHLKKHKSIKHLSYTNGRIEAEARSDSFDVCKTTNLWFSLLDKEVNDLICCWNQIVPKRLKGCHLNRCRLKIFYKGKPFDADRQTKFEADPERVYKLLIGENIYKSRFDFIREYLQNALDASKMQFWLKIKDDHEFWETHTVEELTPFDLTGYEEFRIDVTADIDWDKKEILFSMQDHGIGMEEECIKALSNVSGDSWSKRDIYSGEIPKMPLWLRPTGGFGIGVQSAFMITDNVEFITRSEKEAKGKLICLESNRKGGKVSEYEYPDAKKGTKVQIKIQFRDFFEELLKNKDALKLKYLKENIYDRTEIARAFQQMLVNYLSDVAECSLFPVKIRCNTETAVCIGMGWNPFGGTKKERAFTIGKLQSEESDCEMKYWVQDGKMVLWDSSNSVMVVYHLDDKKQKQDCCYYKGMIIADESVTSEEPFRMQLLYFGGGVTRYLSVSRDKFRLEQQNKYSEDLKRYRRIFAVLFIKEYKHFKENTSDKIWGRMAMQAIVLDCLGMIHADGRKSKVLSKALKDTVAVKRINFEDIERINDDFDSARKKGLFDYIQPDALDRIWECIMFQDDTLASQTFFQDLNKNSNILFVIEEKNTPQNKIPVNKFLTILSEQKEISEYDDLGFDEEYFAWKMSRADSYLITDERICSTLLRYGSHFRIMNIEKHSGGVYQVYDADQSGEKKNAYDSPKGNRLENYAAEKLSGRSGRQFKWPIVLSTCMPTKEEMAYPLWTDTIFPNIHAFDLDKNAYEDKQSDSKNRNYFILPFMADNWHRINRRNLSKEQFLELMKTENTLEFILEWIYLYQTNVPKLSPPDLAKQYELLLNDLYKWMGKSAKKQ